MFDMSVIPEYPALCDLFVEAEFEFLELKMCNRVGWWRLNLILVREEDKVFFSVIKPEDDLQHTAHCAYLAMLFETHFGQYLQNVDFHGLLKSLLIHEVCEVVTGDIAASEPDHEKRKAKKANDEQLTTRYIQECFPEQARAELLIQNHIFNNVEGNYTVFNHAGVLDSFAFLFAIAWALSSPTAKLEDRMYLDMARICRNEFDRENVETAGTPYAMDAIYAGMLRGELRDYNYFPLMIALTEAHYRKVGRKVPPSLKELYPYEIK